MQFISETEEANPTRTLGHSSQVAVEAMPRAIPSSWTSRDSATRRLLAMADVFGLLGALLFAIAIGTRTDELKLLLFSVPTIPVWILLFKLYGLYDRDLKRISHRGLDDLPWLFHALVLGTLLLWAYTKALPVDQLTFLECGLFGTSAILLVTSFRGIARNLATRWLGPERALVVGGGPGISALLRTLQRHPEYGLEPIGRIASKSDGAGHESGLQVLGLTSGIREIADRWRPDRMIVSATT